MPKTGTELEAYPSKRAWAQPKLKEFLDAKGVYENFVTNSKKDKLGKKWNHSIVDAFTWVRTDEGYTFWENLQDEFDKL